MVRATGRLPHGASVGLKLGLLDKDSKFDPATRNSTHIAKRWALAIWTGLLSRAVLKACLEQAAELEETGLAIEGGHLEQPDLSSCPPVAAPRGGEVGSAYEAAGAGTERSFQEVNWARVSNPAQAYMATLLRIGWRPIDEATLVDHTGVSWCLLSLSHRRLSSW